MKDETEKIYMGIQKRRYANFEKDYPPPPSVTHLCPRPYALSQNALPPPLSLLNFANLVLFPSH